jgi:hypothetical protein
MWSQEGHAMTTDLKQQALETFLRDLPELIKERPGQFVAYRGEERLGFSKEQYLMYQDCMSRGYDLEEVVVFCIEPWETEWFMPNVVVD